MEGTIALVLAGASPGGESGGGESDLSVRFLFDEPHCALRAAFSRPESAVGLLQQKPGQLLVTGYWTGRQRGEELYLGIAELADIRPLLAAQQSWAFVVPAAPATP